MTAFGVPLGLSWAPAAVGNWVPGVRPLEPFPAFNFGVEIEGLMVGGFTEVTGLESRLETTPYREGGVNGYTHALPSGANPGTLVLRHGMTASSSLWNWYENAVRGVVQRRNGTIMLLNRQQIPVMWWNFRNALPVAWTGPTLDASSDALGFESVELVHEGLTKPLLGQAAALGHGIAGMAGA
jgi:phage tail-like protein